MNEHTNDPRDTDDCTDHSHPIPASELGSYHVDTDPHSEQDIARYMEIECRGEEVQHVERSNKK